MSGYMDLWLKNIAPLEEEQIEGTKIIFMMIKTLEKDLRLREAFEQNRRGNLLSKVLQGNKTSSEIERGEKRLEKEFRILDENPPEEEIRIKKVIRILEEGILKNQRKKLRFLLRML